MSKNCDSECMGFLFVKTVAFLECSCFSAPSANEPPPSFEAEQARSRECLICAAKRILEQEGEMPVTRVSCTACNGRSSHRLGSLCVHHYMELRRGLSFSIPGVVRR